MSKAVLLETNDGYEALYIDEKRERLFLIKII